MIQFITNNNVLLQLYFWHETRFLRHIFGDYLLVIFNYYIKHC